MRARSSPREKAFAIGILLAFFGLIAILILDSRSTHHPIARDVAAFCLGIAALLYKTTFFVGTWDNSRVIGRIHQSPNGIFWMRLVAITLWLGVLPFACLWVYDYIKHPH